MRLSRSGALQFRQNRRASCLPNSTPHWSNELYPDNSLNKDLVLVERNEASQGSWGKLAIHNGIGSGDCPETAYAATNARAPHPTGPVSLTRRAPRPPSCRASTPHPERKNSPAKYADVRRADYDFRPPPEIHRYQPRALVDQLIESMLPIGAGSPQITGPVA